MTRLKHRALALVACLLLALCACAASTTTPTPTQLPADLQLPAGFRAERLSATLNRPTQLILGPNGRIWAAQLAGAESAGQGQVVAIDLETGDVTPLLDGLQKPTGIALLDGALWIAAGRDLLRADLDAAGLPGTPQPVLTDLPFNGRSNGTLTPTPDGRLLYETSGSSQPGAGMLWTLDPADPANPQPLASGLKGAYAHTFDANGRLWITEIGDGTVDGQPPPEELNLVVPGADFGWPRCYGFQEPARDKGGTAARCAETRPPVVLFPPHSTPTSIAVAPWAADTLLVALWVGQEVVQVAVTPDGDNASGTATPFLSGLSAPQHLLPLPDGALLVSDHLAGTLYKVWRETGN